MERQWICALSMASALLCAACGSGAPTAPGTASSPAEARPTGVAANTAGTADAPERAAPVAPVAPIAPLAVPVDLLHAVRTDLAVSSVYRNQPSQAQHLVDGDLATAWNSRTDELVGAWIEARIPADATVTSIAMTPGFARTGGSTDLFTGNHRIARVRVLRDGTEVGIYPLDVSAPVLVTVPVDGPGGVYRIEVAEVVPGSRSTWRETCVSELQILGRAPGMNPGARLPHTFVGALPALAPAPAPADRAAIDLRHRQAVAWLTTAWTTLQRELDNLDQNTGEPVPDADLQRELELQRDAILLRIVGLVEPIDEVRSDALRIAAARTMPWEDAAGRRTALASDVDALGSALEAVGAWLGDDEARCRSARVHAGIRLTRVSSAVHLESYIAEINDFEAAQDDRPVDPAARRRDRAIERDDEALSALASEWSRNSRGCATRLLRRDPPVVPAAVADWTALRAQLEAARTVCGWGAAE